MAQWSFEEENTIMNKVAKGKGKPVEKMEKNSKWAENQDNESTDSF